MTEQRLLVFFILFGALAAILLMVYFLLQEEPVPDLLPAYEEPAGIVHTTEPIVTGATKQDGTLKGKVIHGLTKEPIVGAEVQAVAQYTRYDEQGKPIWGHNMAKKKTFSRSDGTFALDDLPPDYWNLWVEKEGFGFTSIPRTKFRKTHVVKLYPGGSIRGRVVLPDESPAAGVAIEYTPQGAQSEVFSHYQRPAYQITTDEDGRFRFDGLPPGKFTVEVNPVEYLPAPWKAAPALKPGEDRDLGTHRLDGGFGMLVRVLYFGSEAPVPNVEVSVHPIGDPMPRTTTGQKRVTNEKGEARFQGLGGQVLDRPTFSVTAIVPGMGVIMPDRVRTIGPGETIMIHIRKSGVIKGKVEKADGKPLSYFFVKLHPVGHRQRPPTHGIGKKGEFAVYGVPEGTYTLVVEDAARQFKDERIQGVVAIAGKEVDVGTIIVEEGAEIAGTVTRSNGEPLEKPVRVIVARRKEKDQWEHLRRNVWCNSDGTYRIPGLPQGTFHLWPDEGGATTDPVEVTLAPGTGFLEVDLVLQGEGTIDLQYMDHDRDGRLVEVSWPPTILVEERTGKKHLVRGPGHRLRPGKYSLFVKIQLADGSWVTPKAKEVEVKETEPYKSRDIQDLPPRNPITVRLDEIREAAEAAARAEKDRDGAKKR